MIARGNKVTTLAFSDCFARAPNIGSYDRTGRAHVLKDRIRESFGFRTEHAYVGREQQFRDAIASADKEYILLDAQLTRECAQVFKHLALAGNNKSCIRNVLAHGSCRAQEHRIILHRIMQVRDYRDEPSLAR